MDQTNRKTLWSQRVVASRPEGRDELAQVVFEATDAQLM